MGKKLKKREKTKDELIKSNKTRRIIIIVLVGVLLFLVSRSVISEVTDSSDEDDYTGNYTGNGTMIRDRSSVDKITDTISGFIYGVVELEYPFALKFLIFLGAIYIIQVGISISGDIIQLFLLTGVAIYKIIRWTWTYYKVRGIEYDRK